MAPRLRRAHLEPPPNRLIRIIVGIRQERTAQMRFAVKTRPEHQTWEEIRDAWISSHV